MLTALVGIAGFAAAAATLAALVASAYAIASRIAPESPASFRLARTAIFGYALAYGLARGLLAIGVFGALPAFASAAGMAAGLHWGSRRRRDTAALAARDAARAREVAATVVRGPWGAALAAVLALAVVRVARGLVIPPLGWDSLVYHLFKAGRFVALGRDVLQPGPDGWGHYEFYPAGGSVLWAWPLAFAHDGALVAVAGGLAWLSVLLGAYAAARRLGADEEGGISAALVLGACPAVASLVTAGYVDNFVVALVSLAVATAPPGRGALASGLALGLACTVKASALPVAASAVVLGLALVVARPREWRVRLARLAAVALPIAALVLVEYGRTWARTGNPVYPLALKAGGVEILPGNESFTAFLAGRSPLHDFGAHPPWEVTGWMFLPWRWPRSDFSGLGPGIPVVAALAAVGAWRLLRRSGARLPAGIALLSAAVFVLGAFSPDTLALRTVWGSVFSRHLTAALGAAAAVAATVRFPGRRAVWLAVLVPGWFLSLPRGWGSADLAALAALAPALLAAGALGAAVAMARRFAAPPWVRAAAVAAAILVPVAAAAPGVRAAGRYPIWDSTRPEAGGAYDFHSLDGRAMAAWPIWRRLDEGDPSRVAVTCGWNGSAQTWYLFPLLGSRLQNRVVYVPPTIDGAIVDYSRPEELDRRAQLRAWLRRLVDERIDRVVTLYPSSPERLSWIVRLPEVFVFEWGDDASGHYLYRIDRARAEELLSSR